MRGRTNISGGGGANISGVIKQFEVTGAAIASGDFVQFCSQGDSQTGDYPTFAGLPSFNTSYVYPNKVKKISDNKFIVSYTSASNRYLALIDISDGFTVLDTLKNVAHDFDILSDGTIVTVYNGVYRYKINDSDKFEQMLFSNSTTGVYAVVALQGKFLCFGSAKNAYVYTYDESTITYVTSKSWTTATYGVTNVSTVGIGVVNDSEVLLYGNYGSTYANEIFKFVVSESNSIAVYNYSATSDSNYDFHLTCGHGELIDEKLVFITRGTGSSSRYLDILSVSTEKKIIMLYSIAMNTSCHVCIGKISDYRIILAQPSADDYTLTFEIIDIDPESGVPIRYGAFESGIASQYCGFGFFLTGTEYTYYVGFNGTDTVIIKLKLEGATILESEPMIMPYASIINGVAKGSGEVGEVIDVYVPMKE